jgi:two-component system chemotaxis response regulator CheY
MRIYHACDRSGIIGMAHARLNLKGVTTLLLDSDGFSRGLITSMLRGFGMDPPVIGPTGASAIGYLQNHCVDLCIMEATLPDMSGAELIRWIRRPDREAIRYVPIIVLTSYTQLRTVSETRDGGANLIVRKPVSPQGLFDRITWVARITRPFIDAGTYSGPDRRFKTIEPPDGVRRRSADARDSGDNPMSHRPDNKLLAALSQDVAS